MVAPIDPNKIPTSKPDAQFTVPPPDSSRDKFRSAYQQDSKKVNSGSKDKSESKESGSTKGDTASVKESKETSIEEAGGPFSFTSKGKKEAEVFVQEQAGAQASNAEQSGGPFSVSSKEKKTTDTDADVDSMEQSLQNAVLNFMGGSPTTTPVEGGKAPSDASRAEAAKLAMEMVDKMLINDPQFSGKTGARLTLGGDVNPNLKGVEVVINTQKTALGNELSIQFVVGNRDASNYINQNLEALDTRLKQDLPSFSDIRVDIQQQGGETRGGTGGEGRSKGEYIASDEEQTQ